MCGEIPVEKRDVPPPGKVPLLPQVVVQVSCWRVEKPTLGILCFFFIKLGAHWVRTLVSVASPKKPNFFFFSYFNSCYLFPCFHGELCQSFY